MTRINIVSPSELTDQHLIAEYREIFMVAGSLNRTLNSKIGYKKSRVPKRYILNSGHVYFFYNKGKYLDNRYKELVNEMKLRGFKPDPNRIFPKKVLERMLLQRVQRQMPQPVLQMPEDKCQKCQLCLLQQQLRFLHN